MQPPAVLALVVVSLLWGFNFVVVKAGLGQFPPLAFVALRFAAAAIILLPFLKPPRGRFLPLLGISVTLGLLHFGLMFVGMRDLDAATAAIAVQLQVPFAALLAALVFNDVLGWRRMTGMAIAFAGVALIAGEPRIAGDWLPLVLVIGAACLWSFANVQIKLLGDDIDPLALNGWLSLLAAPQIVLASLLLEEGQWAAIRAADWVAWGTVAYQAVLVTLVGYGIWYRMMQRYAVNQVMPFTLLVPVFGVLASVAVLGERLSGRMIVGGLATVAGVAVIVLRRPRVLAPATKGGI